MQRNTNCAEFFFSADTWAEAKYTIRSASGASRSADMEEKWLQDRKAEYVRHKEPNPEYWDSVKIFKVTIEEVPRKR